MRISPKRLPRPHDLFMDVLPPIPSTIRTREGYDVDTSGLIWRMRPTLGRAINWTRVQTTPRMLRVLMGYVASLLKGKAERTALTEYIRLASIQDWTLLTGPWDVVGIIKLADVLRIKRHLEELYERAWQEYFPSVKRLYAWASGMGVPGFPVEEYDDLERIRIPRMPSLKARMDIAPGAPRSRVSKNRRIYNEVDMTLIAARLLQAEWKMRQGEVMYRPLRPGETEREGKNGQIRRNGILLVPTSFGLPNLVLGWLAWNYGDRPDAFRKLRESHFEFYESERVQVARICMPETKQRHADYRSVQEPMPLDEHLTRLVPELIAENRAMRERLGKDNHLDWPLFPVAQEGVGSHGRLCTALPHEDFTMNEQKGYFSLLYMLQILFEVLQVPNGEDGVFVPTFYSFRDGVVTNMLARGIPPEVVAALQNKQVRSLAPYNKPGISFLQRLDEVPEFSRLAAVFQPADPIPQAEVAPEEALPYFDLDDGTYIGLFGRCGCIGAPCPVAMNGSVDCYLCPVFRAIVEGPHELVGEKLWARRKAMINAGLPKREYERYDRHISVCGEVVRRIRLIEEAAE